MNIFESKWRELLEDLIINHKKHVKDETPIREIIGVHERIDNPYKDNQHPRSYIRIRFNDYRNQIINVTLI